MANRLLPIVFLVLSCLDAANMLAADLDIKALAASLNTGPGCGLGKMVWADYKGQKEILPQLLMATTNTSTGSQTSGISSGTSGCTNDGRIMTHEKTDVFMHAMFESLEQDMAQGRGEHLASLATVLGVSHDKHAEFFALCQHVYESSMRNDELTPSALLSAVRSAMARDKVFAQAFMSN